MQQVKRLEIPADELFSVLPQEDLSVVERRRAKQDAFLQALPSGGWRKACDSVGITDVDILRWKRTDKAFAQRMEETNEQVAVNLEAIVDEIARGEREATPTQAQLLQFRLRGLKPEVYRDRASVQVDQRTTLALDGDGARARMLLAEWSA